MKNLLNLGARAAKADAATDNRYPLLIGLVKEAHDRVPFAPWLVLNDHADPGSMFDVQCGPIDLILEAERESGEVRATAVVRALKDIAEPLYKLYLNRIWLLSYLRDAAWPAAAKVPSFGNLVTQTARRLCDYPGLVEADAGWMRNCVSHHRPHYDPTTDTVEMWDDRTPVRAMPVGVLLEKIKSMYQISAVTFPRAAQLYLFQTMALHSGMLDLVVEQFSLLSPFDEESEKLAN